MKSPDLKQSWFLSKREFTLENDGINVVVKEPSSSKRFHVNYENIPPKPQEITKASKRLLTFAGIFTVLAVICLVIYPWNRDKGGWSAIVLWGGFAAFFWCWFFVKRSSLVLYSQNGAGLALFKDKPSMQEMEAFVKKLFDVRNQYLLKRYGAFSEAESLESKINRLNLLRSQGVISDEEFTSVGAKPSGPVGFGHA